MNPYFLAIAAAVVLDVATTFYNLSIGAREINPVLRSVMGAIGPLPALLVTHGLVLAIAWYDLPYASDLEMGVVAALWWGVVVWNIVQAVRQRRSNRS